MCNDVTVAVTVATYNDVTVTGASDTTLPEQRPSATAI
jgi:hypothetical protein